MAKAKDRRRQTTARPRSKDAFVEVTRPEQLVKILHRLLRARADRRIESILARLHPADIAKILTFLPIDEARNLIRILFRLRKGAQTISELPGGFIEELLLDMEPEMTAELLRRVEPDDAVDILQELDEEQRAQILDVLHIDEVAELEKLLAYTEDTAGAIMNPEYFALQQTLSVDEAIQNIREAGPQLESVFYVYVIDENDHLVGTCSMRDLLLARGDTPLGSIVNKAVVSVKPLMHEDDVAEIIAKYDLLAVPVCSEEGQLIGVITVDDVIDVIQEAATEDLYRMVALDEDDRVFSPPSRSIALRLPWLSLNFVTALLAAITVGLFEDLIAQVAALAAMMPIVAALGGNTGAQTLTVVIRGIALGELKNINARRAVAKELTVGVVNGLVVGILGGLFAWLWKGHWWLGGLLAAAIWINMCVAALGGAIIPMLLKRIKLDPALGSSIFLTTLTDVVGFFTFLGLAAWLLPLLGVL